MLLGEGEGGCGRLFRLEGSRSLFFLIFFSLLLWRRCLSMTNSMLSYWRSGTPLSYGSVLTGVVGGDTSRKELELAQDTERAKEDVEVLDFDVERKSEFDLDL